MGGLLVPRPGLESLSLTDRAVIHQSREVWMTQVVKHIAPRGPSGLFCCAASGTETQVDPCAGRQIDRASIVRDAEPAGDDLNDLHATSFSRCRVQRGPSDVLVSPEGVQPWCKNIARA